MTIVLELEPEVEARLRESAARAGVDETEFVRGLIKEGLRSRPMTGSEALDYWEREGIRGIFAGSEDSPELARRLRTEEETRAVSAPSETP
jgi:hypothetical protein